MLAGLCVTEIVSWGVLYYAFAVLSPTIRADTGWSPVWTTAAFSAALVVAALVGIPVGRRLDRHGPHVIMTAGSVLAVVAVLAIAWSPSLIIFVAGWLLAGIAMAGVLYQPAFAALTGWFGDNRLRALTAVTLVAGLASTVFAPLTSALDQQLSWRQVYSVLAGGLAVITIPIHGIVLRRPWPGRRRAGWNSRSQQHQRIEGDRSDSTPVLGSRPFVLLVAGMALAGGAIYAALVNLVPLLTGRGLPATTAAWLLGLGGIGQVAGRLVYGPVIARLTVRSRTMIIYGLVAASTAAYAFVPSAIAWLAVVIMVAGFGRGIATLLQATAIPDRWGTASYARLSGILAAPITVAGALAPWIGAWLAQRLDGYPAMFAVLAIIAVLSVVLLAGSTPAVAWSRAASTVLR